MSSQVRARPGANADVAPRPGSRLRRLPVPVTEPNALRWAPRERATMPPAQGTLALSFSTERSYRPEPDPDFGPQPTSSCDLPDPGATCSALIQAVIEVLAGTRPASQLARWLSSDVYAAVSRRAALGTRMRRGAAPTARHAVVRGVRVCEPTDGVVEGSAVVVEHDRVRAVAVRLEGMDGRWRATAVEVG